MASIRQRGDTYQITVSCGYSTDGRKVLKTTTWTPPAGLSPHQVEKALHQAADEYEKKVQSGQCTDDNITLAEFVKLWKTEYAEKHLEPTTIFSYQFEIDTKILPALGHIKLSKLRPIKILSFLNSLMEDGARRDGKKGGYGNRTIKYQHQILSSMLQQAVYWQMLPSNPCQRVKPPTRKGIETGQLKHFTEEQAVRFLDAIKDEETKYKAIAYIGMFCAPRRSEILGLTWDNFDLEHGETVINKAGAYVPGKGLFIKSTKNESSMRAINFPEIVVSLLRQHKREQNEQRLKLGTLWHDTNLVFTQWNGLQMATGTPTLWIRKFINRYNEKIEQDETLAREEKDSLKLPFIGIKGLRHTSATLMIANHTDVRTVSARLGHSQTSTTMNIYSHALRASDKKAADALENMLGNKSARQEKKVE